MDVKIQSFHVYDLKISILIRLFQYKHQSIYYYDILFVFDWVKIKYLQKTTSFEEKKLYASIYFRF